MLRVGLTGNIGSGKSSVARVWVKEGASLIDADVLAREAVAPGSPGLARVRAAFGESLATSEGLDRAAMRRLVFDDPDARSRLEGIIHPEVARLRALREARLVEEGARIVVHDIPLLYEVGMQAQFDLVILVDAPEEVREERLVRDRGLDREQVRKQMAAQMPASLKRQWADVVIENAGTMAALEREARRVWNQVLVPRAGAGDGRGDGGTEPGAAERVEGTAEGP